MNVEVKMKGVVLSANRAKHTATLEMKPENIHGVSLSIYLISVEYFLSCTVSYWQGSVRMKPVRGISLSLLRKSLLHSLKLMKVKF